MTQHQTEYAFGSQPLGWYGLGSVGTTETHTADQIIDQLTERYGARLEKMDRYSKQVMRAALCLHQCWLEYGYSSSQSLVQDAIDNVDVDFSVKEPEICYHIGSCTSLDVSRTESLLEALSAQLRHDRVREQRRD